MGKKYVGVIAFVLCTLLISCDDSPTEPTFPAYGEVRTLTDHREVEIRFESGGETLVGTLYLPLTGSDFAVVAENPGSSWTTRTTWQEVSGPVLALGVGVFSYDKRGFGQSGGSPVPTEPVAAFDALSDDLVQAARALTDAPLVRSDRIGVLGGSQGGWVVPLAANKDRAAISYAIVVVGGAFSTGQEGLFDDLTGYSVCQRSALPMDQILDSLRTVGPSGFDPRSSLEALTQPTMWLYGGLDLSHSATFSEEKLAEVQATQVKPWTIVTLPNANHDLIEGGSICQTTGMPADFVTPFTAWLQTLFGPAPATSPR